MLRYSIKNNILSILRDPSTAFSIIASIIICYIDGFDFYTSNGTFVDSELYLSNKALGWALSSAMGLVVKPIRKMLFPFIGIVIAANLYKDKKTGSFDLISAGQITFVQYYTAKIISFYVLSVVLCSVLTVSYTAIYSILRVPSNANFEWDKVMISQMLAMIVSYTSVVWIPIAWGTFFSALTGVPAVGAVFNCVYQYFPYVLAGFYRGYTFYHHYIHVYPYTLHLYLKDWMLYPVGQKLTYQDKDIYGPESLRMFTSFKDAMIAYLIQIGISFVLLTISYFLLKRRLRQSD